MVWQLSGLSLLFFFVSRFVDCCCFRPTLDPFPASTSVLTTPSHRGTGSDLSPLPPPLPISSAASPSLSLFSIISHRFRRVRDDGVSPPPSPLQTKKQTIHISLYIYPTAAGNCGKQRQKKRSMSTMQRSPERTSERIHGRGGEMPLDMSDTRIACAASRTLSSLLNIQGSVPLVWNIGSCVFFSIG